MTTVTLTFLSLLALVLYSIGAGYFFSFVGGVLEEEREHAPSFIDHSLHVAVTALWPLVVAVVYLDLGLSRLGREGRNG